MSTRFLGILLVFGDYVLLLVSLLVALIVLGRYDVTPDYLMLHLRLFGWHFLAWSISFYIEGLYSLRTPQIKSLPISLLRALLLGLVFSIILFYLFPVPGIAPKTNLVTLVLVAWPLCFLWHKFVRLQASQRHLIRVASLVDPTTAELIRHEIALRPWFALQLTKELSTINELGELQADVIVVDRQFMKDPNIAPQLLALLEREVSVVDSASFLEDLTGKMPINLLDEAWFLEALGTQSSQLARLAKNALDRGIALIVALLALPFYVLLLPILLVVSGRPIFFGQIRTGRLNKPFKIWKLRTMVVNAETAGAQWATPGDARITPVGKFLRKTRLDELPQLWNILCGDMSLVGPRPERPEMIASKLAPAIPFYQQRHLVKPGVTGWAQVNFRYGYSTDDALEKLQYDLFYVKNQSFWLDVRILLKTAKTVLTGAGQ